MNWCDERLGLQPAAATPPEDRARVEHVLAEMSLGDLVRAWREVAIVPLPGGTAGTYTFDLYFDRLGHDDPERAVAFIEAVVASEPDDAVVALIGHGKLLAQLLVFNAARATPLLEVAAARSSRMRWLMGSVFWSIRGGAVEDAAFRDRLLAITDRPAFEAWTQRRLAGREPPDFASLPLPELARRWIEITARSPLERERDRAWSELFDYQWELVSSERAKALDLVIEILRIEDRPALLGILAAGMLEDLLPANDGPIIGAVEAEAARDPRFRALLRGARFSSLNPDVADRLTKAATALR